MTHHSLLGDPVFRVRRTDDRIQALALPHILHALAQSEVLAFEALQPHQKQAWHSFLVQLAAMAVAREAGGQTPPSPEAWRTALVGLANGSEPAWHLVTEDVSKPAFLQPPVPEGSLDEANYKADVPTPDQLDILITSKSHDVKARRIRHPLPEHWIYALVTLQTMEGFLGRGNYGIVRMNGGFGNRPLVGLATGLSWGERFQRDLDVLLAERDALSERYRLSGHALLWTEPWDGAKSSGLSLTSCDPYFIEVCRRIRFTQEGSPPPPFTQDSHTEKESTLVCWRANTKAQRVDAPDSLDGDTGDPWTPIEKNSRQALTLSGQGFTYERLQDFLFEGEYHQPPALRFRDTDNGRVYLVAQAMVRGQGKTEGLHHRIVPVPASATKWLHEEQGRKLLARRARHRVELAAEVRRQVLYPAIGTLLGGGDMNAIEAGDVRPWIDAFDQAVDTQFFESLWASVQMGRHEALKQWQTILWEEALEQFDNAEDHAPSSSTRYWRALSNGRSIFYGTARTHLPYAFSESDSDSSSYA